MQIVSFTHSQGNSLVGQLVKNLPAVQETPVPYLGQEDPMEKRKAIHSIILGLPWWLSWYRIHLQCGRPGLGRSLETGKATLSSFLTWISS